MRKPFILIAFLIVGALVLSIGVWFAVRANNPPLEKQMKKV